MGGGTPRFGQARAGDGLDESRSPATRDRFRCEIAAAFTPSTPGAASASEIEVEIVGYKDRDAELLQSAYTCDQVAKLSVASESKPIDTTERPVCLELDDGAIPKEVWEDLVEQYPPYPLAAPNLELKPHRSWRA